MIFQEFSDALAFVAKTIMLREHTVKNPALTNYLDDFLFMVLNVQLCNKMMNTFLEVCQQIGCPISDDKTSGEQILLCFLEYMLLNGHAYIVSVLHDKVTKALILLQWAISKKKVTIKFIQQLTGTLNFLKRAIVPGRAFTRGMYAKLKLTNAKGELLKQHHHIWLSKDFTQDCKVWQKFLCNAGKNPALQTLPRFCCGSVVQNFKFLLRCITQYFTGFRGGLQK